MSNQHLESKISALSAEVDQQGAKIAELQKQLTDMQAAMSCDLTKKTEASSAKGVGFSCHEFGLYGTRK